MKKYGKTYGDIAHMKTGFITENDYLLKENNRIAGLYSKQPKRRNCKCCNQKLSFQKAFSSHGIKYYICENCGHVNGEFSETSDFTKDVYNGGEYGKTYYSVGSKEDYISRMQKVYIPKVRFLQEVFSNENIDYRKLKFLDVGAGSGYYVGALLAEELSATGIEVSADQVSYGNKMLERNCLVCIGEDEVPLRIEKATEQVVSFIGVLEHMVDPHKALRAVYNNENIRYLFFSVPMFSYSTIWEAINPTVFNRQLGGGHTHVFTDKSLSFLYKEYGLEVMGEWRFGTDIADLFRNTFVKLEQENNHGLAIIFQENFNSILDDMQLIIDRSKFCSEIHVVAKKCI